MVLFRRILVIVALVTSCLDVSAQVVSDFAANDDAWKAPNSLGPAFLTYTATGGNPNGYVSARTPGSIVLGAGLLWIPYYFDAPAKFAGNKSAYYGGNIRYDASQSATVAPITQFAQAVLTDVTGVSLYYYPPSMPQPPVFGSWSTLDIKLSATLGYWRTTDASTGTAATQAQILSVLTNINSLQIQGLYSNANVVTRLDNITMYPPIIINAQPVNRTVCDGVTTTFATVASNNPALTYQWQISNPFAGFLDLTNTGGYSNATTATLSVNTTGNFGAGIYRCKISGTAVDDQFTNTVTLAINPLPAAPGATGNSACGPASLTLNATGGAAGQYRWYTVPTGGTAIVGQTAAAYSTGVISTTTNYYVAINNGTCESNRTLAVATINTIPPAPSVTGAAGCNPASVTLTASGGAAGEYRWYTVPVAGTAIAGQTNSTYATPSLTTTTNYYVSINNGACEGARTLVVATINTPPAAPTTTGAAGCNPASVTLTASGGVAGQYRWYTVPVAGTAIVGQTNSTYATPSLTTTTNFYAAINNGTCESTRTLVVATINTPPAAPTTTGAAGCNTAIVILTASGGAAGEYRWYTVPVAGTAIVGQTNSTFATPSLTVTTNYYAAINNGTCESTRTLVVATINTPPAAPTTTGAAGCNPASVTLTASGGAAGEYRWYTVPVAGTAIVGQTNSTYATPSLTTTTNYYVSINNGTCEGARTLVVATINTPPAAPTTTGAAGCNPASVTLTASGGVAGQYRWYTVPVAGTAIVGQTNSTYATPSLTTTTNFYAAINNGTCESTRTLVIATINTPPAAPTTTGAAGCNPASVTLTASGGVAGQYRWYTVPVAGTAIVGQTNGTYATPSLTITTNFYAAINNGTCESTRTLVVATINTPPGAPTTTGGSSCGTGTVILTAAGGAAGQFRWYTVPAAGTAIVGQTNATYTTPSISTTTNYYASINNGTCESARTLVVATINTPPGAPTTTGASSCGTGTVILTAAGGVAGQYRWYTVPAAGTAIAGQANATYTTPSISTTTDYYAAINNGTCESTRTLVVATINTPPGAPTAAGGSSCSAGPVTLTASGGTAGQYRWYTAPSGGTAIAGETNSTYTTPSISTTTNYYASIDNGTCEGTRILVVASIGTPAVAPTTTGGSLCGAGSVTLTASGAAAGQYRWYTTVVGGTAIAGTVNDTYATPVLSATTTYYVAIDNGCEGPRAPVTATVNVPPSPPTTTGEVACIASSITLTAAGGSNGQYRWYATPTGGSPISGAVNSTFATPVISATTSYYVAINDGTCESSKAAITATIGGPVCAANAAPVIETTVASTTVGGMVVINLQDLITDTDNNLVLSTLTIVSPPPSGATATIDDNFNLIIDYSGKPFSGTENVSVSVCDAFSACTVQTLSIEVSSTIEVYDAVSPNRDGKNDTFIIDGIDKLEDTKKNRVKIFNRWGDMVWEGTDYNNSSVVFAGLSSNNVDLPSGTYYYKIEFFGGKKTKTGFISLKK